MEDASSSRYDYDRFGCKAKRVGQAIVDIMSKDQPDYTAEDILDAYAPDYAKEIEKSIHEGMAMYRFPFFVYVLTKKEQWAANLVRNFFIPRQTAPDGLEMMIAYPNHTKTLYEVKSELSSDVRLVWSLPGFHECKSILRTPNTFSPELVQWILDCFSGRMSDPDYIKKQAA